MPPPSPAPLPDAVGRSLLLRLAPPAAVPFLQLARLDRPIGYWLLLLPCWWSSSLASLAAHRAPNLWHLALFFIGAVTMRGAGCTYNDIIDRDLDARVERTRDRPLASGRVSVAAARLFVLAQALLGLVVVLQFNLFTIGLGMASLAIVAVYPLAKRVTSWPQLVLGLAFAWGGLVGWSAESATLATPALFVYAAAVAWTVGYDTIYAVQDARDDPAAGIRSTARLFGAWLRPAVGLMYAAALVLLEAALAGACALADPLAQAGVIGLALHFGWQLGALDGGDPAGALRLFRSNRGAGLILFGGWVLATLF